jgi:hypothetical protein
VDHQALGVEDHLFRVRRGGDVESGRPGHLLASEVGGQVQVDVGDPRHQRLGVGVDVARLRRLQDRRNRRLRRLGQGGRGDAAEQQRQQDGAAAGFKGHGWFLCDRRSMAGPFCGGEDDRVLNG